MADTNTPNPNTLQSKLSPSPYETELDQQKRRKAEERYASGQTTPGPGEQELDAQKRAAAVSRYYPDSTPAANTQEKPDAPVVTSGSNPPGTSPGGGVSNTVTDTQSEVNTILGRKPSAGKLRAAVDRYEQAAAGLREQQADTTDIDSALAEAKRGYDQKVDRNEMLSLVQMVAQGFAKLAAYNYGAHQGRYIADQVNVPGVDYEKRNDRALGEYKLAQDQADRGRSTAEREADRRNREQEFGVNTLKERVGAEENIFGRETTQYDAELAAARARDADAKRAGKEQANQQSLEERLNRQFGSKEYDNVQQEEAVLRQKQQAVTALAGAMAADDKRSRAAVPALAAKAGVDPQEVEKFKQDTQDKGLIWDSDNPQAAANAISTSLLPGIRTQLDAMRERKRVAETMMSTGVSLDKARTQSPQAGSVPGNAPEKQPTPDQLAKYKQMYPNVTDEQATRILTDRLNGRG